ncbi:MAG: PaaI family thioesterase [Hyphomonas sp.]
MTAPIPPEGYSPHFRKSGFTTPWEPLFSRIGDDDVSIGVFVDEAHCNSRNVAHGAFIAALADNSMGLSCGESLRKDGRVVSSLETVTLTTDYIAKARIGDWVTVHCSVVDTGEELAFASCIVKANDEILARSNATYRINKG